MRPAADFRLEEYDRLGLRKSYDRYANATGSTVVQPCLPFDNRPAGLLKSTLRGKILGRAL